MGSGEGDAGDAGDGVWDLGWGGGGWCGVGWVGWGWVGDGREVGNGDTEFAWNV